MRKLGPTRRSRRDVGEHFHDYALDHHKRHRTEIDRAQREVGRLNSETFVWLGHELNATVAQLAAEKLFDAVINLCRTS